jgi:hypothetical protein
MTDYRTPDEWREQAAHIDRINTILDQAVADAASVAAAQYFGEPAETVNLWVDRVWDGLRDSLDPEDRLQAILVLLEPRILRSRDSLLAGATS